MKLKQLTTAILLIALTLTTSLSAQVTIGSGEKPNTGALLDLKQEADGSSKGGLGMPRVALTSNSNIANGDITGVTAANKDAHIGLLVYNTGEVTGSAATLLCPGLHVWDGDKWQPLKSYPVIDDTKIIISEDVSAESGRTDITGTAGYAIGLLGQFTDTRGPGDVEVNQYHHARFYAYRVQATGDVTYKGIRNTNVCNPSQAVVEEWIERGISFEYVDDGVWMTENMNTEYLTAASPDKMLKSAASEYVTPQYFSPLNTGANTAQIKQNGLLYNWAAATNQKGGTTTGQENVDNPSVLQERHSLHKKRQGICPNGWHLPSDKEINELEAVYAPSSSNFTINQTKDFIWEASYNTSLNWRPDNLNVFGHGKSMKSTTPLNAFPSNGDSKTVAAGGFNLLLAGISDNGSTFNYGTGAYLWSSSSDANGSNAWYRYIGNANAGVFRSASIRSYLFSVRCKRN